MIIIIVMDDENCHDYHGKPSQLGCEAQTRKGTESSNLLMGLVGLMGDDNNFLGHDIHCRQMWKRQAFYRCVFKWLEALVMYYTDNPFKIGQIQYKNFSFYCS